MRRPRQSSGLNSDLTAPHAECTDRTSSSIPLADSIVKEVSLPLLHMSHVCFTVVQVCQAGGALRRVDPDLLVQLLRLLQALIDPGSKFIAEDEQVCSWHTSWLQPVLQCPGSCHAP